MARVVITGASGLLGGNLAAELVAAGHHVIATRRRGTKTAHLDDLPIEWRDADLADREALARAFTGAEAVFHCAAAVGIETKVTREMTDTNVGGTERVIDACIAAAVARLVHTSSVVAIGLTIDGRPCDETAVWNFDTQGMADGYSITKHQAEVAVRRSVDRLDAVIVNPAFMFGPRDARPSSGKMIIDIARRRAPGWTDGYNNFADVRDVARGMIAAWQRGRRGERYLLCGHELTYHEVFDLIAKVAGVKPPRFRVPYPVARVIGRVGDVIEATGRRPLVNSMQIRYAYSKQFRFASTKAARELGYMVSSLEPAIRDAIAWFRGNRML